MAVATTTGSSAGTGAATADDIELESADIAIEVEVLEVFGVVATGVAAGAAIGVKSVVANTTM